MKVSLFVTCLIDQMAPRVGVAAVKLLGRLGVRVSFDPEQTCCGQPAFNTGYRDEARQVARHTLSVLERQLESADYVVIPSGSCATMIKKFYAELFEGDADLKSRAERAAARSLELSQFLTDVLGLEDVGASYRGRVTYHDSCHLLRELGVAEGPRKLIRAVSGAEFVEMDRADSCCGFGGTFSIKYPEISAAMAAEKVSSIERSGADAVVSCDFSCLMQIEGLARRRNLQIRCMHLAELLSSRGD